MSGLNEKERRERDTLRLRAEARALLQDTSRPPTLFVIFGDEDSVKRTCVEGREYVRGVSESVREFFRRILRDLPVFGARTRVVVCDVCDEDVAA